MEIASLLLLAVFAASSSFLYQFMKKSTNDKESEMLLAGITVTFASSILVLVNRIWIGSVFVLVAVFVIWMALALGFIWTSPFFRRRGRPHS